MLANSDRFVECLTRPYCSHTKTLPSNTGMYFACEKSVIRALAVDSSMMDMMTSLWEL